MGINSKVHTLYRIFISLYKEVCYLLEHRGTGKTAYTICHVFNLRIL